MYFFNGKGHAGHEMWKKIINNLWPIEKENF